MRRALLIMAIALALGAAGGSQRFARAQVSAAPAESAFPGAMGWGAASRGGRDGRVIRVTNLNSDGPGSLREAIAATGPRIIVFEVGGVIDLDRHTIVVREPFVTIAGQTAPSPGITLIRGGMDVSAHDVIMQHIRIRSGSAGQPLHSGWEEDSLSTQAGAYNVIVDHCTLTWATDENMSASGPRFTGDTPEEWRAGASHNITFSQNIAAEGLADSTHSKLEHSKGSLIHDNTTNILIYGNLYAHNFERNPLFKGGVRGAIVNNLIYDPGQRAIHYNLMAEEWGNHAFQNGQMVVVGNVMRAGPSTVTPIALVMIGGYGDLEYYGRDNIAVDRIGQPIPTFGRYTTSAARIIELRRAPLWPEGLTALPAVDVQRWVLANAGARPWDRDYDDVRLIADVAEGRGRIINSQDEIHGYPHPQATQRAFNPADWDLRTMQPINPAVLDSSAHARGT
ncbi:MAG TPA: pectate lyase [Caulobacterales bacterium]|nr:pectate lyase [Caulobacterales bacterium]